MDCYILHTALLVIILLFIFAIICHHYSKQRSKQKKTYFCIDNIRMENNEVKVSIKNCT